MPTEVRITAGPLSARIAFVGEVLGTAEVQQGKPLVGPSGEEFNRMLATAGLLRKQRKGEGHWTWQRAAFAARSEKFFITNVFHAKVDVEGLCVSKAEATAAYPSARDALRKQHPLFPWPKAYSWNHLGKAGKYLHPEHLGVLPALQDELAHLAECNVVVPLGGVALWALAGKAGIMAARGTPIPGRLTPHKLLPTFNPAFVLRNWQDRPIVVADLHKVAGEAESPEIRLPSREVWIVPTLRDLETFYDRHIKGAELIAIDAEWANDQIEMIGFASSAGAAIVVPFVDYLRPGYSYWTSKAEEAAAWRWCRKVLEDPALPKVAHNSLADVQVLWQKAGIPVRNCLHDTMFAHHALQPEMKKSLGFLASLYTREASWKFLRKGEAS